MADACARVIEVELVYALAHEQVTQTLQVEIGTRIGAAIEQSGVLARHPELATGVLKIGIFGRRVPPATVLREYDRIEIYRPLVADPKQARLARARKTARRGR